MKVSKKVRSLFVLLLVMVSIVSLSACGGSSQSNSSESTAATTGTTTEQSTSTETVQSTTAPAETTAAAPAEGWYDQGNFTAVYGLGSSNTGTVTMEFDATPVAEAFDSVIGFAGSATTIAAYTDLPVVVKFATTGEFQARNGGAYEALASVKYTKDTTYHFRMVINMDAKTYDVFVTPQGGTETALAQNYAFRSDAAEVKDLGKLTLCGTDGTHDQFRVNSFLVNGAKPAAEGWYDKGSFTAVYDLGGAKTGTFTVEFDATPVAEAFDSVIGFAGSATTIAAYTDLPVVVKFATTGEFQARNGGAYEALASVKYTKDTSYHFRLVINMDAKTYDVFVTPQGGTETALAQNYAFRSDAAEVKDLGKLTLCGTDDSHDQFRINNFAVK